MIADIVDVVLAILLQLAARETMPTFVMCFFALLSFFANASPVVAKKAVPASKVTTFLRSIIMTTFC